MKVSAFRCKTGQGSLDIRRRSVQVVGYGRTKNYPFAKLMYYLKKRVKNRTNAPSERIKEQRSFSFT